jgi:beta-lactamase superfamily II metal-dependent hydrolase
MSKKKTKGIKRFSLVRIAIFIVICALACGICFGFKTQIENLLNKQTSSSTEVIDENGLKVHFIDVGQGDCIAIRFPDGKKMLVDSGTKSSATSLVSYLKSNFFADGDTRFDYLLLTHSDADHSGGMVTICDEFEISKIFRPYIYCVYTKKVNNETVTLMDETDGNKTGKNICESATYYNTIKAFNDETTDIVFTDLTVMNTTQKIEGDGYSIDFYAPTQNYITKSAGTAINDFSPIMVLNYNGKKIMLTGDASTTSEENAMKAADLPDVDVLKVGHHGSATSSGQEFLEKVKPEYAIISVGANNSYNHPTQAALNRLASVGAQVLRTDQNGNILVNVTSGANVKINIFFDTETQSVYISVEYILAGIVVLGAYFCFGTFGAKKSKSSQSSSKSTKSTKSSSNSTNSTKSTKSSSNSSSKSRKK